LYYPFNVSYDGRFAVTIYQPDLSEGGQNVVLIYNLDKDFEVLKIPLLEKRYPGSIAIDSKNNILAVGYDMQVGQGLILICI